MVGRIYEEHGGRLAGLEGRLTRVEVGQEQLSHDLRAVAEGVTGNAERLDDELRPLLAGLVLLGEGFSLDATRSPPSTVDARTAASRTLLSA